MAAKRKYAKRKYWAAYVRPYNCAASISLHLTEGEALDAIAEALEVTVGEDIPGGDPDEPTPVSNDDLRDAIQDAMDEGNGEWDIEEVEAPAPPKKQRKRCGDVHSDNPRDPDEARYRCTLTPGHTGDHVMETHPMHPAWKNLEEQP